MAEVHDDTANSRFTLSTSDGDAIAVYERQGDTLAFVHTEVPEGEEGEGIGTKLIDGALTMVRARGERIVPACGFVRNYVADHPEVADLVA